MQYSFGQTTPKTKILRKKYKMCPQREIVDTQCMSAILRCGHVRNKILIKSLLFGLTFFNCILKIFENYCIEITRL